MRGMISGNGLSTIRTALIFGGLGYSQYARGKGNEQGALEGSLILANL